MEILKLVLGLVILIVGAEALVKGASRIAFAAGISSLVVGLTVVAFGTSAPELAVSILSAFRGSPDIALGNVVGSNIFNVLFILGISSLIIPLVVAQQLIRLDVPVMIGASFLVLLFGLDGVVSRWEGVLLFLLGIAYTSYVIWDSRREKSKEVLSEYQSEFGPKERDAKVSPVWVAILYVLAGLGLLILGSQWLVDGAVFIAHRLGVSDLIIGLTIIAAGTSLPEVATSIIASLKGERDIAVGNVVGSNIFNILIILGVASAASPDGIHVARSALHFDIPFMIAVAVACLPIFFTGTKLDRWEGGVFLFYYIAYTVYLVLNSQDTGSLSVFRSAMIWFVVPITVLTLIVVTLREVRNRNKKAPVSGR